MRPAVATVVSASGWEHELVAVARTGAAIRVVRRCHTALDVEDALDRADVIVIGAETAWLSSSLLRRWRSRDIDIIGMVAPADRPGRDILLSGGVTEILTHNRPPGHVIAAIASISRQPTSAPPVAPMATVVGPRGSPGRSEVALTLAWIAGLRQRTLLAELDSEAPGLGIRLGLPPDGGFGGIDPAVSPDPVYRRCDPIELVTLPPRHGPLSRSLLTRVIEAARAEFDAVVVDAGPKAPQDLGFDSGRAVLVVHPSPNGLVRAGRVVADWQGPAPLVVANRVPAGPEMTGSLRLVRAATGLEPAAAIPILELEQARHAPAVEMVEGLLPIARALFSHGQRRAAR